MKIWTKQAELRLQEYLNARIQREGLIHSDARELREDLSSHIYEEAESLEATQISSAEVEEIIGKLEEGSELTPNMQGAQAKGWKWVLFFGSILPLFVCIFEIFTGFCGAVFFDPVPTVWHSILVISVPLINGWQLKKGHMAKPMFRGITTGIAVTISCFYGFLFLPLLPISVIALVILGLGLISLTPIFAAWASWRIMLRTQKNELMPWVFKRGFRLGFASAALALMVLEAPSSWTRYQLSKALSEDAQSASEGIKKLRFFHSERTLLRACYEGDRGTNMATDISGWLVKGWSIPLSILGRDALQDHDSEKTREVFFRSTGRPFNSIEPPRMVRNSIFSNRNNMRFNEFEFDHYHGGDQVALRLKDLDLSESRFDGHVDSLSRSGYGEWTMVFKNAEKQAKEARCQVRLPSGGKVSRLTLWVNGEPREAAFHSVEKVKAAYKSVAVVQRLDPVLITMSGTDTIMVQCFPVPAGGEIKIRFGVTAPLHGNRWELPRVIERNFGISEGAEQALWLQADKAFEMIGNTKLPESTKDGDGFSTNAIKPLNDNLEEPLALRFKDLPTQRDTLWCEDPFAHSAEKFLACIPSTVERKPIDKLVVVIDGSLMMAQKAEMITRVLQKRQQKGGMEIILANDDAQNMQIEELSKYRFYGGCDNQAALRKAVTIAKKNANGAVVWLHGPQAVELAKSESLLQLLERGTQHPTIFDVEIIAGPNRLADQLGRAGALKRVPTFFQPEEELSVFLDDLLTGGNSETLDWKRYGSSEEMNGKKVWDHLARIWAMEYSESNQPNRAVIAAKYQLVTPVSGAVVLETMQQFNNHGLEPIEANAAPTIPSIPEPSTGLLFIITATAALLRRQRPKQENDYAH